MCISSTLGHRISVQGDMLFTLLEYPQTIFMQYLFDGMEDPFHSSAHGKSKRKRSSTYVCTKESTVQKLQRKSSVQTPKAAYHTVHKEKGVP